MKRNNKALLPVVDGKQTRFYRLKTSYHAVDIKLLSRNILSEIFKSTSNTNKRQHFDLQCAMHTFVVVYMSGHIRNKPGYLAKTLQDRLNSVKK